MGLSGGRGDGNRFYGFFKCDCGSVIERPARRVISTGQPSHCGCQTDRGAHRTHGMHNTPEYRSWQAMKARCLDPNNKDYPRWGGRGVTVCKEWVDSFDAFFDQVGPRPKGTTLDRIDNRRGYEPGNVRWATNSEQMQNTRLSREWHIKGGVFPTVYTAAEHFGVSAHTVWRWVNGQYDKRRGRFTPPRDDCYATRKY